MGGLGGRVSGDTWARDLRAVCVVAACLLALSAASGGATPEVDEEEARCLALTLYWEAREEGRDGMLAVGWVVLNRLKAARYPSTICAVVREGGQTAPCQFSYWCDGRRDEPRESESWAAARALAIELISEPPPDPTHGATHFHREDVRPAWSGEHRRTARLGRHIYYR